MYYVSDMPDVSDVSDEPYWSEVTEVTDVSGVSGVSGVTGVFDVLFIGCPIAQHNHTVLTGILLSNRTMGCSIHQVCMKEIVPFHSG